MNYDLVIEVVRQIGLFEQETKQDSADVHTFGRWLNHRLNQEHAIEEPEWQGKSNGRSADSVINTTLVHLYRYAKLQAKAAIAGSAFSTPDEFIYLISLMSFGSMTKTSLIKLNVHEKSAGMQIVKRLIDNGLVEQTSADVDKRNRMLHITPKGRNVLEDSMQNIRQASKNITEPLSHQEKMELIKLLTKLEDFHESRWLGND